MTISDADTGFFATATVVVEKSGGEVRVGSASISNNSTTKPDRYYLRDVVTQSPDLHGIIPNGCCSLSRSVFADSPLPCGLAGGLKQVRVEWLARLQPPGCRWSWNRM